jgi:hypothetical protein
MVTDNEISYAETLVRRLEETIAAKKHAAGTEAEIKALEAELALRKRDAMDLRNRKRRADDQARREKEQKDRDDRRKRFA